MTDTDTDTGTEVTCYSDAGLVLSIRRHRDGAALAEVHRRHAGRLFDLAGRLCGPEQGELVVRDVLLDLWREPERFETARCSLRWFLLAQAHARAVAVVRAGRGAPADPKDVVAGLADSVGDHAWPILSTLPDDQRDAVALAWFGGYGCSELAELLEEPRECVARRLREGLTGLGPRAPGDRSQR